MRVRCGMFGCFDWNSGINIYAAHLTSCCCCFASCLCVLQQLWQPTKLCCNKKNLHKLQQQGETFAHRPADECHPTILTAFAMQFQHESCGCCFWARLPVMACHQQQKQSHTRRVPQGKKDDDGEEEEEEEVAACGCMQHLKVHCRQHSLLMTARTEPN